MKLSLSLLVLTETKRVKPGCDPATLGYYDIPSQDNASCKRWKGFNTVPDQNGIFLERKGNYCPRKCKYANLPTTVQAQCKCVRDRSSSERKFDCYYRMKIKFIFKGFKRWDAKDEHGNFYSEMYSNYGQAKQEKCVRPNEQGEWMSWSEWGGCESTIEGEARCGLSFRKRTRECDRDVCFGGGDTQTKACVAYDYYGNSEDMPRKTHPQCGNHREEYKPHENGETEIHYEGTHCVFPTFGKGWWQGEIDGQKVSMGLDCHAQSRDVYDNGDHVILPKHRECKLVCRGDDPNDETEYVPQTSEWNRIYCYQPIPVPFVQNLPNWIEQGLNLKSSSDNAIPWYFDRQTKECRSAGCSSWEKPLLSEMKDKFDKCYKIGTDPKCPSDVPPLTNFEAEMGTIAADGITWSCTDGSNLGSVCTKMCTRTHLERAGNRNMICQCNNDPVTGEKVCNWERTQRYENGLASVNRHRSASCIRGCDAYPYSFGEGSLAGRQFNVTCDQSDLKRNGALVASAGLDDHAKTFMWNSHYPVTPINQGNTCRVRCFDRSLPDGRPKEWQMPTYPEKNYFDIKCMEVESQMRWVALEGDRIMDCQQVCPELGREDGEVVEPIWTCTNDNFVESICVKSCPRGYKMDNTNKWEKTSTKCRAKSSSSANSFWSTSYIKKCILDEK